MIVELKRKERNEQALSLTLTAENENERMIIDLLALHWKNATPESIAITADQIRTNIARKALDAKNAAGKVVSFADKIMKP